MNNLHIRIILISQYFLLFFNFYAPPNSNICSRQCSRQIPVVVTGALVFAGVEVVVNLYLYLVKESVLLGKLSMARTLFALLSVFPLQWLSLLFALLSMFPLP